MTCLGSFNDRVNVNNTADASVEIIAAETDRRWEIGSLVVSTADAGTYTLQSGSTTIIGPVYIAANDTHIYALNDTIVLTKGEALNLSKTAAHDYTVFVQYRDFA